MSSLERLATFRERLAALGLRPRPAPAQLERLLARWELELPADYVALMTELGPVGGPGYGLVAPDQLLADGLEPQTHRRAGARPRLGQALVVADHGCAEWDVLVTQGECVGQVWRVEAGAVRELPGRPQLLDWYAAWLDEAAEHGLSQAYRLAHPPRVEEPEGAVTGWSCGLCEHRHADPTPPERCPACAGPRSYLRALR